MTPYDLENIFALTITNVLKLEFGAEICTNQEMVCLINKKGNKVYIKKDRHCIKLSAYKVSARCYYKEFTSYVDMVVAINELKIKLKL